MRISVPVLLIVLLAFGCGKPGSDTDGGSSETIISGGASPAMERPVPSFEKTTLVGDTLTTGDFKGRVTLVNFWATWCGPCIIETPELVGLQEEWKDRPFQIVGVSQDTEGFEVVRPFVDNFEINYPQVWDDGSLGDAFGGIIGLPTSFLVDADGIIRHRYVGMIPFKSVRPKLEDMLKELERSNEPG